MQEPCNCEPCGAIQRCLTQDVHMISFGKTNCFTWRHIGIGCSRLRQKQLRGADIASTVGQIQQMGLRVMPSGFPWLEGSRGPHSTRGYAVHKDSYEVMDHVSRAGWLIGRGCRTLRRKRHPRKSATSTVRHPRHPRDIHALVAGSMRTADVAADCDISRISRMSHFTPFTP